ncbi:MAG: DUF4252 domain-containing protein [bacterium]
MKTLTKIIVIFFLAAISVAVAQKEEVKKMPGYIEFGDLSSLETGDEVVEVLIEGNLIKMVSKLTKKEDPALSELLSGIHLIKVNAYDVNERNEQKIKDKVKSLENDLTKKDWQQIVKVRDKNETANVFIKTQGDENIIGLFVVAVDKNDQAAFVNIVGKIDLETIGRLGEKFDIPSLDKISEDNDKK